MRISTTVGMSGAQTLGSYINQYSKEISNSLERIASGKRIANASDDPTSYFRSQSLDRRAKLAESAGRGLEEQISQNKSASSVLDTVQNLLEEMSGLAKDAAAETDATIRGSYGKEYDKKFEAIKSLITASKYNGETYLNGKYDPDATGTTGAAIKVQIGEEATDTFEISILDMTIDETSGLNLDDAKTATADFGTSQANATTYFNKVSGISGNDSGMARLKRNASRLQTNLTVLSGAQNALNTKSANYQAASSAINGVDDATESTRVQSMMIRQQAAASFLAQSNGSYGGVVSTLLRR